MNKRTNKTQRKCVPTPIPIRFDKGKFLLPVLLLKRLCLRLNLILLVLFHRYRDDRGKSVTSSKHLLIFDDNIEQLYCSYTIPDVGRKN